MKKSLKAIALCAAVSLAVFALWKMGSQVGAVLTQVDWTCIALAVTGLAIYQWLNAGVWKDVLCGLGQQVSRRDTTRVWIRSESMKWLPGGIWGYGSRVINAGKLGVPIPAAAAALAAELSLTVIAWGLTALCILPTQVGRDLAARLLQLDARNWLVAAAAAIALCAIPKVRVLLGKVLRRFIPVATGLEFRPRPLSRALLSYLGLCLFNGTLLWLVTLAVPGLSVPWSAAIGIGGVAWLVGFFAIGVPGGIGVREAALAGLLVFYGPMETAVAAAILFRAAQVAAELIALAASFSGKIALHNRLAVREIAALD